MIERTQLPNSADATPHPGDKDVLWQRISDRLTQAIAFNESVDALAQQFCIIAAETFGDMANLTVLNRHNEMIHIAGLYDVNPRAYSLVKGMVSSMADQPRDQGLAAHVISSGEPIFVPFVPAQPVPTPATPQMERYMEEIGVGSLIAIPLKGRTGMIGAFSITRHKNHPPYSRDDLALLERMGLRIAASIDTLMLVDSLRAQLSEAVVERNARLQRDAASAEQLSSTRAVFDRILKAQLDHSAGIDALAQEFCVIVSDVFGGQATLLLRNPHNDMLHLAGLHDTDAEALNLLKELRAATPVIPRGSSIAGEVLRTGAPILRASLDEEDVRAFSMPAYLPYLEHVGIGSMMAIPLRGRNGSFGVLTLNRHRGTKPLAEADLQLLSDMGLRIQLALDNGLLAESLQEQMDTSTALRASYAAQQLTAGHHAMSDEDAGRLEALHRLTHLIAENRDRQDRMMELSAVLASDALRCTCIIGLLNEHNELLHIAAYYDTDPRARQLTGDLVRATADMPRDSGNLGSVIKSGKPLILPHVDEQQMRNTGIPAVDQFIDEIGVSSLLVVPLKGPASIVGAINVSRHRGQPAFTEADQAFLEEIAYRIAVGVENQQLIDSLRHEVAASSPMRLALGVSEQRFRSVFDSAALGIEIMDAAGVILDINRAFESMSGYSRADMVGQRVGTLQHPDDTGPFLRMFTELKMNRQPDAPVENRILHKDGSFVWVKTYLAPVKKPDDGAISLIVALHEDITGRKEAERYFQAVLEATPDALVMIDAAGKIMLLNRQAETLFGYARHELLGLDVEVLIPERFRESHPLDRAAYVAGPHIRPMGTDLELFALARDGREIPVEVGLSPLDTPSGKVIVAAVRNITDRKMRDAAIVRSERSLTEAQRVARLGSIEFDLLTGALEASDEALRILGLRREELTSSEVVLNAMHPDDRQRVRDLTQQMLADRVPREFEFRVLLPNGGERIVHDRIVPYFAPDGKPSRALGTLRDITEQRLAENEMTELKNHLQSNLELERLRLAQELHDGPMQDLYGAIYRIEELERTTDQGAGPVLGEVSQHLQDIVGELRGIAKELRPPAISNFGLEKAIRSYVEDFQQKHPAVHLHLSLARDHQMLPENVRITLFRVFQQALGNVLRHSQASEVEVRFTLDAEEARLAVIDNGHGFDVPPNWMGFVRQGHYGLAGAAERVSALGGTLLVESSKERGSTITAVVPWTPTDSRAK